MTIMAIKIPVVVPVIGQSQKLKELGVDVTKPISRPTPIAISIPKRANQTEVGSFFAVIL